VKAPPAPHRWQGVGYETLRLHALRRGRLAGELDELVDAGSHSAYVAVCLTCGVLAAHVHRYTNEGTVSLAAYGFDRDSLGVGRAPSCEVLAMPAPAGEELAP
jgi:hypothetical protein